MGKYIIGLVVISLLIVVGSFFLKSNFVNSQSVEKVAQNITPENPLASPTPIPFEELTIPYLRARNYESKLGELEQVSTNSNYTSYLTSYTSDGLRINGLLTIPKGSPQSSSGTNKWPAIVFVHGYIPPDQYQTLEKYGDYIDFLARNGFVVLKIDLRGHGDSEGEAGGGYYSSDYVIDTLNARAALQSTDFVNPDNIGLWGHSMAGNVTARAMAAKPEIKAVVIWAGAGYSYLDLNSYGIQDASYQPQPNDTERQRKRQQLRALYGDPKDGNPFWNLVAPTSYLNDLKGAIELHHAVDDNVVSIEYSRNLDKLLDATSVPHNLYEYSSGGHNLTGSSFSSAMQRTVDFYRTQLQ